jgi:hypothetical protein
MSGVGVLAVLDAVLNSVDEDGDGANGTHYVAEDGRIRCKGSFLALIARAEEARADFAELVEALRPLVATSFEDARNNEDQRRAAIASCRYPPAEMLWCRADVLNPCWIPGTAYTGKHWGWTPILGDGGAVCEHCRLRAALARFTGGVR